MGDRWCRDDHIFVERVRNGAKIPFKGSCPSDFLPGSKGLGHAEGAPTCFTVASGGGLPEGYGHAGPGVCLGDGQTEAQVVPSQGGRGDVLLGPTPHI